MIEYFLSSLFKERARRYSRRKIEKLFNALLLKDPDYEQYLKAFTAYRDELAYSNHCGSIRDDDHNFNIRIDREVDRLKVIVDEYHKKFFGKYWNEYSIPTLAFKSVFSYYSYNQKKDVKNDYKIHRELIFTEYC